MSRETDFHRRVSVGSTSANTGDLFEFNQSNTAYEDFAQACLASSSVPGFFNPQSLHGMTLYDGGDILGYNIYQAVNQCMELVDDFS